MGMIVKIDVNKDTKQPSNIKFDDSWKGLNWQMQ